MEQLSMSGKSAIPSTSSPILWATFFAFSLIAPNAVNSPCFGQWPDLPSARPKDPGTPSSPQGGKPKLAPRDGGKPPELWNPGDEIDAPKQPVPVKSPSGKTDAKTGGNQAPTGASEDAPAWSVLLATFSQDEHAEIARSMRERIAMRYPQLKDCFVASVSHGSVILVGRFAAPGTPEAQAKLKEVKAITADGQRPFATSMLTRTETTSEGPGPYDVRRLRQRFPTIVPLYSLQVGVWSTFGEKSANPAQIREAADRYCKELRLKGFEAWVHHDGTTNTSSVCVGHFDHNAYDSKSTLYSSEVAALMKQFPRHLMNGEELAIPIDPQNPKGKTRPQACQLVEIPR